MGEFEIQDLVITATFIFLLAPAFLVVFMILYNQRRKMHSKEKDLMQQKFDTEIARAQLEVQEQTMQTIGADLHDNIGQLLSLTSLTLKSIDTTEPGKTDQKLGSAIELVTHSIQELRLLGKLLDGDQLIALGLDEAIRHEIKWLEKAGKFKVSYQAQGLGEESNADKDLILFRILQEAMNNIIKHARAKRISIILVREDDRLKLDVSDNGIGFEIENIGSGDWGIGLQNIKKRASLIGGEATITSRPQKGTDISISIPYP